ncbi:MAG: chromate transporter [Clostridia bacterium]|nr:chromate transporter [Clostridia bacterium]
MKIGAVMFGGGYSMLPLLIRELVDNKHWCTEEEVLDYFSLAQCTPGVIAINSATFVGYKRGKVWGGIIASLGVVTVPIIIITVIAAVLQNLMAYPLVQHLFAGVRIAVAALMTITIFRLVKKACKDGISVGIVIVSFALLAVLKLNSVWLVLLAAVFGIAYGRWFKK